jgi:hypothetical protein
MAAYLFPIPVMMILTALQSTAVSRIQLMSGSADLVLLAVAAWGVREKGYDAYIWALIGGIFMSMITEMPLMIPVISYMVVALLSQILVGRIWQSPIIMLIIIVIAGTIFQHVLSVVYLQTTGANAGFILAMRHITLPSLLLNLFFIFPMYVLIGDLRRWIIPEEDYE